MKYNLSFISDDDLFKHVQNTINKYKQSIDFKDLIRNVIDPIKLTFDSIFYDKSIQSVLENETLRQMDKSNNNNIGYFHQNIFNYIDTSWLVPKKGWDIVNSDRSIYVEMKNKHNTINSSSSQKTYITMQSKILHEPKAQCFLVEVIAKKSQNIPWSISIDSNRQSDNRIRKLSIDKFYEIVTGKPDAFFELCVTLPSVIKDVVCNISDSFNSDMLNAIPLEHRQNILNYFYYLTFGDYNGFENIIKQPIINLSNGK
jgi:hypothetical protein